MNVDSLDRRRERLVDAAANDASVAALECRECRRCETAAADSRLRGNPELPDAHAGGPDRRGSRDQIDGRTIPVLASMEAHPPGLNYNTPDDVRRALELMPKQARDQLQIIHLDSGRSSSDPRFQRSLNDPTFRAYMTAGPNGLVTIHPSVGPEPQSVNSMVGTLVHEAGHFDSFTRWTPQYTDDPKRGVVADPKWTLWKA